MFMTVFIMVAMKLFTTMHMYYMRGALDALSEMDKKDYNNQKKMLDYDSIAYAVVTISFSTIIPVMWFGYIFNTPVSQYVIYVTLVAFVLLLIRLPRVFMNT